MAEDNLALAFRGIAFSCRVFGRILQIAYAKFLSPQPEKVAPIVPAVKVPVKQSPKPKPMVEAKKETVQTDSVKETTVVKQKPVGPGSKEA